VVPPLSGLESFVVPPVPAPPSALVFVPSESHETESKPPEITTALPPIANPSLLIPLI
jgi:hypothetical protein